MWLITANGFISIVQDRKDKSQCWIRARVKEDIIQHFPNYADKVVTKIGADYIYRLIVPKEVAALVMWNQVMDVDYDSHAKEVMNRRSHPNRDRMSSYYACWTALAKMQPYAPYAKTPKPVGGFVPRNNQLGKTTGNGSTYGRGISSPGVFSDYDEQYFAETGFKAGKPVKGYGKDGTPVLASDFDWDQHPQSSTYKGGDVAVQAELPVTDDELLAADGELTVEDLIEQTTVDIIEEDWAKLNPIDWDAKYGPQATYNDAFEKVYAELQAAQPGTPEPAEPTTAEVAARPSTTESAKPVGKRARRRARRAASPEGAE